MLSSEKKHKMMYSSVAVHYSLPIAIFNWLARVSWHVFAHSAKTFVALKCLTQSEKTRWEKSMTAGVSSFLAYDEFEF